MTKEVRVYLEDILESIGKIEEYAKGSSFQDFEKDTERQDAVIRRLEIIGEAVKNLPSELRKKYPNIPWKQITGTRDILIHEYAGVSLKRVWKTVVKDLEPLKKTVNQILQSL